VFDHTVTEQQNSIIALKEIAEFGALVSPEAMSVYKKRFPYADPQKINERATKSYSENIIW
jgi:hypothetical protein